MSDKSKQRKEADAAFERATSRSREAPADEAQPVSNKTSKLKELRLERDGAAAEGLKPTAVVKGEDDAV
jgi:hypothetical protein